MSTSPPLPGVDPGRSDAAGVLHGLAELAFGSITRFDDPSGSLHLGLLPTRMLELDLKDPVQRQFGDYELEQQIGEGGMGVVYRARQKSLAREVAVKLLAAGPWASKDFIARFEREAQNAARMQHPNIVTVYEVGSIDGLHFFSMRLVVGESLSARLKAGRRLAPRATAQLMRTVAEATAYAHSLGVLHLDLKPGNVLLDEAGVPYVTDFGLARRLENALAVENEEVSGTPAYMAPEQAQVRSQRLTAATDIWGLGAILYELLTGQPPFRADTAQATVKLVLEGKLWPPRRVAPAVPLDLEAVVMRCLAREPADRYGSARELADDLQRYLDGRPVQARPLNLIQRSARWARREPRVAVAAGLAVGILVAGLAVSLQQWHRAEHNAETARGNATTASERLWDSRSTAALNLMATRNDWGAAPLLLANLAEAEAQGAAAQVTGARRALGIIANNNPILVDSIGVQPIANAMAVDAVRHRVAIAGQETGIRVFDAATGRELARTVPAQGELFSHLVFAADGRTLLAQRYELSAESPRPAGRQTGRLDLATGRWLDPPAAFGEVQSASYSDTGRFAVLTGKDRRAQFWATDPWRPLGPRGSLPWDDADNARLVAPDGSGFVLAGPVGAVTLMDARTLRAIRVPIPGFGSVAAWAISPDSHWVAVGDHNGRVVVVDRRTRGVRELQPHPAFGARWLTFSDDGGWLALAAEAGGVYLWSWPQGRLLAPPFSGNSAPGNRPTAQQVELDPARNLVLVKDNTENIAVWQVAPTAIDGDLSDARRITAGVDASVGPWSTSVSGWDPAAGMFASVRGDRLRLERLRASALKSARGAPRLPGTVRFDGRRIVKVDGRRVQVVDALNERPLGKPLDFPQAVSFAELAADGATLVVATGRELRVLDAADGRPRFGPIVLGGAPTLLELSPDGQRVATAWLASSGATERATSEITVLHSLVDGRRLGGPVALPGPTNESLQFSDDGLRLLAWNPRELTVRDGHTLAPVDGPLANFRPRGRAEDSRQGFIRSAAFDGTGGVVLVCGKYADGDWQYELRRHLRTGGQERLTIRSENADLNAWPLPGGRGTAITGSFSPMTRIVAPGGATLTLPETFEDGASLAATVSPDGRWFARALRDGVELFDLDARRHVALLHAALRNPDRIWKLAFSADGNRLLARSIERRQLVWDLTPDARPVEVIGRTLALRGVTGDGGSIDPGFAGAPSASERATLRRQDPGAPGALPAPLPARAAAARDPATPERALGLDAGYDVWIGADATRSMNREADYGWIVPGLQRLDGTDYDLRGAMHLSREVPFRVEVASPGTRPRVAALEVLVADAHAFSRDGSAGVVPELEYADGGRAVLSLPATGDPLNYWRTPGRDTAVRIVAFGLDPRAAYAPDRAPGYLFAMRFANPEPARPVRAVTLRAASGVSAGPVVFAATWEPVMAEPAVAVHNAR